MAGLAGELCVLRPVRGRVRWGVGGEIVKGARGEGQGVAWRGVKADESCLAAFGDLAQRPDAQGNGQFQRADDELFDPVRVAAFEPGGKRLAFLGGEGFKKAAQGAVLRGSLKERRGHGGIRRRHKTFAAQGGQFLFSGSMPDDVGFHMALPPERLQRGPENIDPVAKRRFRRVKPQNFHSVPVGCGLAAGILDGWAQPEG